MDEEGVAALPIPDLLRRPVALGVAFVVAVPAVGGRLDERRSPAFPNGLDRFLHGGGRGDYVVAVHGHVVDSVSRRPLLQRHGMLGRRRRELGVSVVLAEEDHRQLPDGGQVQRFVERALGHRPVTEERHRHAAFPSELGGGSCSHRYRQAGGHDAVGSEDADARVGDMHRAAAAPVGAPPPWP